MPFARQSVRWVRRDDGLAASDGGFHLLHCPRLTNTGVPELHEELLRAADGPIRDRNELHADERVGVRGDATCHVPGAHDCHPDGIPFGRALLESSVEDDHELSSGSTSGHARSCSDTFRISAGHSTPKAGSS